ncbi:MAG: DVU0298 family protein [Nitrospirota bacterium]
MTTATDEPRCPFCYHRIEQPKELSRRKVVEFPLGACSHCGATYAYDTTGHNMGAAFIEALLFACNEDEDLAFSLSYEKDYTDAIVGNYDIITHAVVEEKVVNERYVRGALVFVKLLGPKVTGKGGEELPYSAPLAKTTLRSEKFSKEKVRQCVVENRLEDLLSLAEEDSRVLHELQRMLYTPDEPLRWKVIDVLGAVSGRVGRKRPDLIENLIKKLLQSAASPGASAWGALEAVGAIISAQPYLFGEFIKPLLSFQAQKNLWRGVAWAAGKIATADPGLAQYAFRALSAFLDDSDPVLRGYAAWALGNIGSDEMLDKLRNLETDDGRLSIWTEGAFREVTVGRLAKEAVEKITG